MAATTTLRRNHFFVLYCFTALICDRFPGRLSHQLVLYAVDIWMMRYLILHQIFFALTRERQDLDWPTQTRVLEGKSQNEHFRISSTKLNTRTHSGVGFPYSLYHKRYGEGLKFQLSGCIKTFY